MPKKQNVTYMLRCSDGTLYTGWTNNIEKRLKDHNAGKGGKYTRARTPVELVYLEAHETKQEAMSREVRIKQLTRREKEALIKKEQNNTQTYLTDSKIKCYSRVE